VLEVLKNYARDHNISVFVVPELTRLTRLDRHRITELFIREPGVLVDGRSLTDHDCRRYVKLRIPLAVALRVFARRTNHERLR
jgi:hypothetical protein